MLIYVQNFKIIWSLRYSTCGCLYACSTHPVNIFAIQSKLYIFRAKHRFSDFLNKLHSTNRKTPCATRQTYTKFYEITSVFISCFIHMILFMFSLWNLYLINCSICSIFLRFFGECLRRQEIVLLQKGTWFVAWLQSVRMPHQRTYTSCEKQEYQVFHSMTIRDLWHKHDQCECWSIAKGEGFFEPILNTWHFTYHSAVYMWNWSLFQILSKIQIYPKHKSKHIPRICRINPCINSPNERKK